MRDAPRHKSAPRCKRKIGRRASRTACDAERRTIVKVIVPHAPAWECRA
ncbi:DUF1534 domain-containing protein [Pseudomonas amygdali pv. lachrymans str. M301315]|uniref:DUF1534 domain-containing protein n=1 Tax=Pseudomonas amygdali pv. lachrymans str. M301315 TaxID=629260 RepID=A0AAD0PTY4_PSEAV|nr:hypothetical protein B5U27_06755 [Pseudomonas amygdali pv. lachrymans]AXH57194.1 DUF1534 domain-containing protein [Pseudomonas amygdali pv. lachrymans str. M301315]PWD03037.1 DUF1534 domain-containing protein [Pseudomonas amygdali pv. lachrymans]